MTAGKYRFHGHDYPVLAERVELAGGVVSSLRLIQMAGSLGLVRVEERTDPKANKQGPVSPRSAYVAGEVIVSPVPTISADVLGNILKDVGAHSWDRIYGSTELLVRFRNPDLDTVANAIHRLVKFPEAIAWAEPNSVGSGGSVPNDPEFPKQRSLNNTNVPPGTVHGDIRMTAAWDIVTSNPGAIVAVLDSGFDFAHPDLSPNAFSDPLEVSANGVDDDGNGFIDDHRGWDFVDSDNDPTDDESHGTHIAGIIGAKGNNALGIAGVVWSTQLLPVKVLNSNNIGAVSWKLSGINYALAKGATVMNLSLGYYGYSTGVSNAIQQALSNSVLMVIAAGNLSADNDLYPNFPSSYTHDNIIAVANSDDKDALNGGSSYGATSVDLAAPGTSILSTYPHNNYSRRTGTSMAAPHVTGVAALLLALRPGSHFQEVKDWILNSADYLPALEGRCLTEGRLNAHSALSRIVPTAPVISASALPREAYFGEDTRFRVSSSGTAPLYFQWWKNDHPLVGSTNESLKISAVNSNDLATYYVMVTNAFGSATSSVVTLTATLAPPLRAWGENEFDELTIPSGLHNLAAISAGEDHTLALQATGTVLTWGRNNDGQLNMPAGLSNVVAISGGSGHSLVLEENGSLTAWGHDTAGVTTIPTGLTNVVAISSRRLHCLALKMDGSVVAWGRNEDGAGAIPVGISNIIAISAGNDFSCVLNSNGKVTAWGKNNYGQTNVPTDLSHVVSISAANGFHTLALRSNGTVVAWGRNQYGQSTVPAGLSNVVAVSSGLNHSLALRADGTMVAWGFDGSRQGSVPSAIRDVVAIDSGDWHNLALTTKDPPVIGRQPIAPRITSGGRAILRVGAVGGMTYQWYRGSSGNTSDPIGGATREWFVTPPLALSTSYWVRTRNMHGASDSETTLVTVGDMPRITKHPQSRTNFLGDMAAFSVVADGGMPLRYQWWSGGVRLSGVTNDVCMLPAVSSNAAGPYFVVVSNFAGVVTSLVATLTVVLPMEARFVAAPALVGTDLRLLLEGTPGATYTIEYAASLAPADWQKRTNLVVPIANPDGGIGRFDFRETVQPDAARFYRTVFPPY